MSIEDRVDCLVVLRVVETDQGEAMPLPNVEETNVAIMRSRHEQVVLSRVEADRCHSICVAAKRGHETTRREVQQSRAAVLVSREGCQRHLVAAGCCHSSWHV